MLKGRNKAGQRRAIKAKQYANRVSFNYKGISKLPRSPGMYKINSNGHLSYIGSTNNLRRRAREHMRNRNDGTSLSYRRTVTRQQASTLERNAIRGSCPPRNRVKPVSCKGFWERNFGVGL